MAWEHHGYIVLKRPRQKLAELRLHIIEVTETLADPTAETRDGFTYSRADLVAYRTQLMAEMAELEMQVGVSTRRGPVILRGRFL